MAIYTFFFFYTPPAIAPVCLRGKTENEDEKFRWVFWGEKAPPLTKWSPLYLPE